MTAESNIYWQYILKLAKWFMLTMPILMLYSKENGLSYVQDVSAMIRRRITANRLVNGK